VVSSAKKLAAGLIILAFAAACAPQTESITAAPADVMSLSGAGATFPSPLYQKWFRTYEHDHPAIAISYEAVGSGEGVRRFIGANVKATERIDFGASDAAMSDEQIAQVPGGVLLLPLTAGCVTLSYNLPGLDGELRLSRRAYTGIFLGRIRNWNDPLIVQSNPGLALPDLTIATIVRQDASGTTFAFTKHLEAASGEWRKSYGAANLVNWPGNAMRAEGNEGVAGRIQHSAGSIGYVGYEFAHRLGLRMASIENKSGAFVKPGEQSCAAALASAGMPENFRAYVADPDGDNSYPIVTFSWVLLRKNYSAPKTAVLHDVFTWCLRSGQQFATDLGYVPLPPAVASKALVALDTDLR
jgi:phosphate transport system substrate-binding protein